MSAPGMRAAPAPAADAPAAPAPAPTPWVQGFVVFLLVCQVALLFEAVGGLRTLVRGAAFGTGLVLLVALRGRGGNHPAWTPAALVMALMALSFARPDTANPTSGAAQAMLYLAVMSPLFWVARLRFGTQVLRQTMLILWVFHTASATVGVLQVYFPGSFQWHLSEIVASKGKGYINSLMFTTASGARVFRPMGLYDAPGAAAVSAMYAILLGTGYLLTRRGPWNATLALGSMGIGMVCMYLSQVRSALVTTMVALAAVVVILVLRREGGKVLRLGLAIALITVGGYTVATAMAGPTVTRRVATLTATRPGEVYYSNRGRFLEDVFTRQLPRYPFGQGLGHWGMTAAYFGRPDDAGESVWVEIQWAGWAADGGVPLMLAYAAAIAAALYHTVRAIGRARALGDRELEFWGVLVLAYSLGMCALTFSYPVFIGQPGMEFWLLNSALFVAARSLRARPA